MGIPQGPRKVPQSSFPSLDFTARAAGKSLCRRSMDTRRCNEPRTSNQLCESLADQVVARCILRRYGERAVETESRILLDALGWLKCTHRLGTAETEEVMRNAAIYLHWDIPPAFFNDDGGGK